MKKPIVVFLLSILLISACGSTAASASMPICEGGKNLNILDYATWTKVNPKPIKGHEKWVNIYVDDAGKDIYLSASGETFPVCARIVKTILLDADSDKVILLSVMIKMPPGYDPEHNDWYWGEYNKNGQVTGTTISTGKVQVCFACHSGAATADYVFSKKVMEESTK
jgi:Cytochrome P460